MSNEVHYLVTTRDIAHLSHHITQRTPMFQRRRRVAGALVGLSGLLFFSSLPMGPLAVIMLFIFMLLSTWMMFGSRRKPNQNLTRYFEQLYEDGRNRGVLGPHRMLLHEEHLEVQTQYTQSSIKWEAIDRIEEDEEYIYFFVSAINAHVVQKAAFPSPAHAQAFISLAHNQHTRALQLEASQVAGYLPPASPMPPAYGHAPMRQLPYEAPYDPPMQPRAAPPMYPAPAPPRGGMSQGGGGGTDGSV